MGLGDKRENPVYSSFVLETLTSSSVSPEYFSGSSFLLDTVLLSLYLEGVSFQEARMIWKLGWSKSKRV